MQEDYSAKNFAPQLEPLSEWLSAQIELRLSGDVPELPFSIEFPVSKTSQCVFCREPIAEFQLDSGEWFDAPLKTDAQGITRAVVTAPHRCPEMDDDEDELEPFGLEADQ